VTNSLAVAVCRRGHIAGLRDDEYPKFCDRCGAGVYGACPSCGREFYAGMLSMSRPAESYPRSFCRHCGQPYPWATREDIVSHVENILAEHRDLPEGDRRLLADQLESLRQLPEDAPTESLQANALDRLRSLAPKVWESVLPIVTPILTAELKRQLGLPPS
jgi:hypothetical protein